MPVFGNFSIVGSDTTLPGGDGRVFMTRFYLSEAGTLNHIGIYSQSTGGGFVRGVVYADNAGSPGALVAVGAPVAVVANSWVQSACSGEVLPVGWYWQGGITQNFQSSLYADDIGGDGWAQWGDANYASPPDPWSGGGSATYLLSVYADYTAGGVEPPEGTDADVDVQLAGTTLAAEGVSTHLADLSVTLDSAALQANSVTEVDGNVAVTLDSAALQADVMLSITADVGVLLQETLLEAASAESNYADFSVILADSVLVSGANTSIFADFSAFLADSVLQSSAGPVLDDGTSIPVVVGARTTRFIVGPRTRRLIAGPRPSHIIPLKGSP